VKENPAKHGLKTRTAAGKTNEGRKDANMHLSKKIKKKKGRQTK